MTPSEANRQRVLALLISEDGQMGAEFDASNEKHDDAPLLKEASSSRRYPRMQYHKSPHLTVSTLTSLVLISAASIAFAQGSPTPSTSLPEYLYVATNPSEDMFAYRIDSGTGALTPVHGQPFTVETGASPQQCGFGCFVNPVADPLGRFLFYDFDEIPNSGFGTMRVDPVTGALRDGNISLVTSGEVGPISTDPRGRFIFGNLTAYGDTPGANQIQSYVVYPDGHLSPAPGQPYTYEGNDTYSAPAASDNYVYVSNYNTNYPDPSYLSGFGINQQNGGLALVGETQDGIQASNQVITPSGKFLYSDQNYSTSGPFDVQIAGFIVNADGSLTPINQAPQQTPDQAVVGMVMSPNGNFLYSVYPGDVRAYAINPANGTLTLTAVYTNINTSGGPLAIDPAVKYVYLNQTTYPTDTTTEYSVVGFRVNPKNGELAPLPGSPVVFQNFPTGMAIVRPQQ
jgi:6-phosphogluconolactonase (cycloisomerase 2 family)